MSVTYVPESAAVVRQQSFTDDAGLDGAGLTTTGGTIYSPAGGNWIQLLYVCAYAAGANTASVVVSIMLGSRILYKIELLPGSAFARNIGAGRYGRKGAPNESLSVTVTPPQTIQFSYELIEYSPN